MLHELTTVVCYSQHILGSFARVSSQVTWNSRPLTRHCIALAKISNYPVYSMVSVFFFFFFVSRPRCEQRSSSLFQPCVESLPTYVNNIKHALITFNSFRRLHNHPYHLFLFGSGTEPKRNRFLGFECHNHLLVFHHVHPLQTY